MEEIAIHASRHPPVSLYDSASFLRSPAERSQLWNFMTPFLSRSQNASAPGDIEISNFTVREVSAMPWNIYDPLAREWKKKKKEKKER